MRQHAKPGQHQQPGQQLCWQQHFAADCPSSVEFLLAGCMWTPRWMMIVHSNSLTSPFSGVCFVCVYVVYYVLWFRVSSARRLFHANQRRVVSISSCTRVCRFVRVCSVKTASFKFSRRVHSCNPTTIHTHTHTTPMADHNIHSHTDTDRVSAKLGAHRTLHTPLAHKRDTQDPREIIGDWGAVMNAGNAGGMMMDSLWEVVRVVTCTMIERKVFGDGGDSFWRGVTTIVDCSPANEWKTWPDCGLRCSASASSHTFT